MSFHSTATLPLPPPLPLPMPDPNFQISCFADSKFSRLARLLAAILLGWPSDRPYGITTKSVVISYKPSREPGSHDDVIELKVANDGWPPDGRNSPRLAIGKHIVVGRFLHKSKPHWFNICSNYQVYVSKYHRNTIATII